MAVACPAPQRAAGRTGNSFPHAPSHPGSPVCGRYTHGLVLQVARRAPGDKAFCALGTPWSAGLVPMGGPWEGQLSLGQGQGTFLCPAGKGVGGAQAACLERDWGEADGVPAPAGEPALRDPAPASRPPPGPGRGGGEAVGGEAVLWASGGAARLLPHTLPLAVVPPGSHLEGGHSLPAKPLTWSPVEGLEGGGQDVDLSHGIWGPRSRWGGVRTPSPGAEGLTWQALPGVEVGPRL